MQKVLVSPSLGLFKNHLLCSTTFNLTQLHVRKKTGVIETPSNKSKDGAKRNELKQQENVDSSKVLTTITNDNSSENSGEDGAKSITELVEESKILAKPLVKRNLVDEAEKLRNYSSKERNFITPLRAMQEYLLQPQDLIGIRKTLRRSPHADEPPILVYWTRDVEKRYIIVALFVRSF